MVGEIDLFADLTILILIEEVKLIKFISNGCMQHRVQITVKSGFFF